MKEKISELRAKNSEELLGMLLNSKKELLNLRFQRVSGELSNTARVRDLKKLVARIKTILRAEQISKKKAA